MFFTNFRKPVIIPHEDSGEVLVETAGYVPLVDQIASFNNASSLLQNYRESQYMYKDDSLAERDSSMPADIFADKLEVSQMEKDFAESVEAKINSSRQQSEEATSEAKQSEEATSDVSDASEGSRGE